MNLANPSIDPNPFPSPMCPCFLLLVVFFSGTTLNLLKFPIINPTPYRLFRRQERLQRDSQQTEEDMSPEELKRLQTFSKQGYLLGEREREINDI